MAKRKGNSMSGRALARAVSGATGYPERVVWDILKATFPTILRSVMTGRHVTIRKFGSFRPRIGAKKNDVLGGEDGRKFGRVAFTKPDHGTPEDCPLRFKPAGRWEITEKERDKSC